MAHRISRRRFMQTTAAASAALAFTGVTRNVLGANEKLRIACVGTDGQASFSIDSVASESIVAFADCDNNKLQRRAKTHAGAVLYRDYREMLTKEEKNIDAVIVATPDHHHAPATARALIMGKHVYCEKPLTHTVREARTIIELTKKHKCVTQMGTQIHAGGNYRRVVEFIQSGGIGTVNRVHTWVGTQYSGEEKPAKPPVPNGLDWDLWLGPAPFREYHTGLHPFSWRGYWDFGGGGLADMACHHMDLPFWALGLRAPTSVSATGPAPDGNRCPTWEIVDYQFPAREAGKAGHGGFLGDGSKNPGGPEVHLTWYNGDKRPPEVTDGKLPKFGGGNLFIGDKGILFADYGNMQLFDNDYRPVKEIKKPQETIPNSKGHHQEWIAACKAGYETGRTTCNFDYSGSLTEAVLLGNVSFRSGKKLAWDAAAFKTDSVEADKFLDKEYRKGWNLTGQERA
jgi:predicted dehydrogenase